MQGIHDNSTIQTPVLEPSPIPPCIIQVRSLVFPRETYLNVVQRRRGRHAPCNNDKLVALRPRRAPLYILHRALFRRGNRAVKLPVRMEQKQTGRPVVRFPRRIDIGARETQHGSAVGAPLERGLLLVGGQGARMDRMSIKSSTALFCRIYAKMDNDCPWTMKPAVVPGRALTPTGCTPALCGLPRTSPALRQLSPRGSCTFRSQFFRCGNVLAFKVN